MRKIIGVIVAGVLAFATAAEFSACSKTSPVSASSSDAAYFTAIAQGTDGTSKEISTSDEDALNDGEMYSVSESPLPPSTQSVADDHYRPLKWGRYIKHSQRVVTQIDMVGDSVAIVHVQVTYTGVYTVSGLLDGVPTKVEKPFTETLHRLFRFVRYPVGDGDDDGKDEPRNRWKLDAVSILNGGTGSSAVAITEMSVMLPTGDMFVASDPDSYFMEVHKRWMRELPLWGYNIQVTVSTTVHSMDADTDIVTLHYCPKSPGLHRKAMTMLSQSGDGVVGYTRVYSTTFVIPGNEKKISHLLISATTRGSLYSVESTEFASVVWGLPYKTSE